LSDCKAQFDRSNLPL